MMLRLSHWVWIFLLIGSSAFLYHTSYKVQEQEQAIAKLKVAAAAEHETIQVLEAEWAALTAPSRLQHLSDKFLQLEPVASAQIVAAHRLPRLLPRRDPAALIASKTQPQLAMAAMRPADAR